MRNLRRQWHVRQTGRGRQRLELRDVETAVLDQPRVLPDHWRDRQIGQHLLGDVLVDRHALRLVDLLLAGLDFLVERRIGIAERVLRGRLHVEAEKARPDRETRRT